MAEANGFRAIIMMSIDCSLRKPGKACISDSGMAADCVRHARMFFNRPDFDLAAAAPGSYALVPHDEMLTNLEQDYRAMSGMIFGEVPAFGAIVDSIVILEKRLNG